MASFEFIWQVQCQYTAISHPTTAKIISKIVSNVSINTVPQLYKIRDLVAIYKQTHSRFGRLGTIVRMGFGCWVSLGPGQAGGYGSVRSTQPTELQAS